MAVLFKNECIDFETDCCETRVVCLPVKPVGLVICFKHCNPFVAILSC